MKKSLIAGLAAVAFATVSACSGLSGFSEKHAGVEFADVYAQAETFETKAYVTIRLYEATVDAAIFACDEEVNPEAAETPDEVCIKAAEATAAVTPGVKIASRSLGNYVYLDNKVSEILADGKVVPDEVLAQAGEAFFKARADWAAIEPDVRAYIGE